MFRNSLFRAATTAVLLGGLGIASSVRAQTPVDNTKVNTRDRAKSAVTADQPEGEPRRSRAGSAKRAPAGATGREATRH